MFRWIAYVQVAVAASGVLIGLVGVGQLILGPAAQRTNAVAYIANGFGGAAAFGLLGGGMLMATRAEP